MTQTRDPTTGQLLVDGSAYTYMVSPESKEPYPNSIPTGGPYSAGPVSVRIESGISTTRKRLTFQSAEQIRSLTIFTYHNASTLASTDAHDEQDYLMFVVNSPTTATADQLLNSGDTSISSPDIPWPVYFAKPGVVTDYAINDEGIYITHVDVISGDSAGAGPDLGVWIGGRKMSYGSQKKFGNGIDPSTLSVGGSAGVNCPFLLTAKSVTNEYSSASGASAKTANNQKLRNVGGSHWINLYSDGDHDLLNGAVLETRTGVHGTTFGLDESAGVATLDGNWVAGNGSPGTIGVTSVVTAATLSTLSGNSAPILSSAPSANCLLFIIAELTGTATFNNIRYCGFDLRGYRQDTSSAVGAIGIQLGDGPGGWGAGCIEAFTAPATFDMTYREQVSVPTINGDGIVWATAMAVNGTAGSIGAAANSGVMQAEDSTSVTASDTAWSDTPAETDAVSVHLGEGEDSSKLSFYAMGIRNYSAAITRSEIELSVEFMSRTGKLPPWWASS